MHLILSEKEYCIATKDSNASVNLLIKPPNVNPDFHSLMKEKLTSHKIIQLENKTKLLITAYLTQEDTSKEIV